MYFENEDELTLEVIEEILADYRKLLGSGLLEEALKMAEEKERKEKEERNEGISW